MTHQTTGSVPVHGGEDGEATRRAQVKALEQASNLVSRLGPVKVQPLRRECATREEFIAAAATIGAAQSRMHVTTSARPRLIASRTLGPGVRLEVFIYAAALRDGDEFDELAQLEAGVQDALDQARGVGR